MGMKEMLVDATLRERRSGKEIRKKWLFAVKKSGFTEASFKHEMGRAGYDVVKIHKTPRIA